jgi:DNA replication and repair protein RecF
MVTSLSLTNFRSYVNQVVLLNKAATIVVGPNASGKTNLLEALYVLATTKSFRAKDFELINHGNYFYRLELGLSGKKVALGYQEGEAGKTKKITHNDAKVTLSSHMGMLQCVLFEPNDTLIIYGSPDRRRRYINGILSQSNTGYLKLLQAYRRVLLQRNKLISEMASNKELFAWDMKLSEYASQIYDHRYKLFKYINEFIPDKYREISNDDQDVCVEYKSSLPYADLVMCYEQLQQNRDRDMAAGFTTIGPHRDDFAIMFKGGDIDVVASRGEIRSVILALKTIELQLFEEVHQKKPILLLDDVFSELDEYRRGYLVDMVKEYQTVITTTNADSVMTSMSGPYDIIYTKDLQSQPFNVKEVA